MICTFQRIPNSCNIRNMIQGEMNPCFTTVNNSLDVPLVCTVARNFRTKCIKVPEAE